MSASCSTVYKSSPLARESLEFSLQIFFARLVVLCTYVTYAYKNFGYPLLVLHIVWNIRLPLQTPIHNTPQDSLPVNNFKNVTFEEHGHKAPTRFNISEDSPPDLGNMSNMTRDHGYEDDGTQGNILSLQASEALIVLSATSVPETWKFNVDLATETLPLDSPTLTVQHSDFENPAHHDAQEDASIVRHHKDLP